MQHWDVLLVSHVVAALFSLVLGPVQIFRRKRDRTHKAIGYLWVGSMYYVCLSSFWIISDGHFTWLHGLSAFTIVTVTLGLIGAVKGKIASHRANMIGSYIGIAIAFGIATSVPSRRIPRLLATDPGSALFVGFLVLLCVAVVYISLIRSDTRVNPRCEHRLESGTADTL